MGWECMTHSKVFFLTEPELNNLDFSRFHEQSNPIRYRNCANFIAEIGQIELHVAGLIGLPPDELIPHPTFRIYVRQIVKEWPSYWLFLTLEPPYLLYHLAALCEHVLIANDDQDGSYRFSIPAEEVIALLLSQYGATVTEAASCGVPRAVVVVRLWDVLASLKIEMFSLAEPVSVKEHEIPYMHMVTAEEIRRGDISRVRRLFEAAIVDGHTASVMRGSIQLRYDGAAACIDSELLREWSGRVLTLLPESVFLLTLDDQGLIPLLKWFIPKNETLNRLEVVDLFGCLMACYPTLLKLEVIAGNGELHAITRLRSIFQRLGYVFCF